MFSEDLHFDIFKCVRQRYDRAASMALYDSCVQTRNIQVNSVQKLMRIYSENQHWKLALSNSRLIPDNINYFGTFIQAIIFFKTFQRQYKHFKKLFH